jgi:hypothetical protein
VWGAEDTGTLAPRSCATSVRRRRADVLLAYRRLAVAPRPDHGGRGGSCSSSPSRRSGAAGSRRTIPAPARSACGWLRRSAGPPAGHDEQGSGHAEPPACGAAA